jgi:hypothetical protein
MVTKLKLVEDAYAELALAGWVFDLDPEELDFGLRKLETQMASDAAQDLNIGYAFGNDINAECGLPLLAQEAAYLRLAINLAASKGKSVMPTTKVNARRAMASLTAFVARGQVQQQQYPGTMPRGAGNKPWRSLSSPFFTVPDTAPLQNGADGGLEFLGE